MRRKLLLFLLITLFISLIPITTTPNETKIIKIENKKSNLSAYTEHNPISILSEQDLVDQGWPGSGTVDDPYRISNLNITNSTTCVTIKNTRSHILIENCLFVNNTNSVSNLCGVQIENATNINIENCYITGFMYGVYAIDYAEGAILYNQLDQFTFHGINIEESENIRVQNNTISNTSIAIRFDNSTNVQVDYNNITQTGTGIQVIISKYVNVSGNCIVGGDYRAIYVSGNYSSITNNHISETKEGIATANGHDSNIIENEITDMVQYCIEVYWFNNCLIKNNRMINTGGILLEHAENITIHHNEAQNSFWNLVLIRYGKNCTISNNLSNKTSGGGVYIEFDSEEINIIDNTLIDCTWSSLILKETSDSVAKNNYLDGSDEWSILSQYSKALTIENNTCMNSFGISIAHCQAIDFSDNQVSNVSNRLIEFYNTTYSQAINNNMKNAPIGIWTIYSNHIKIENNSIQTVEYNGIEIKDSESVSIKGCQIQDVGISSIAVSEKTSGISIVDNVVNTINLYNVKNITIYSNVIKGGSDPSIIAQISDDLCIRDNIISGNDLPGVSISQCDNVGIHSNLVMMDSGKGIEVENSYDVLVVGNFITGTTNNILRISHVENITIYTNAFNWTTKAVSIDTSTTVVWTNNTHGNYWRDYTGPDADLDGIGDMPYDVGFNNIDPYPLTTWIAVDGFYHLNYTPLAISSVTHLPSSPSAGQEINVTITVDTPSNVIAVVVRYSLDQGATWFELKANRTEDQWFVSLTSFSNTSYITYQVLVLDISGEWIESEIVNIELIQNEPSPDTIVTDTLVQTVAVVAVVGVVIVGAGIIALRRPR